MVRLDLAARSVDAHALDDIGIDGALGQPTGAFNLLSLCVEDINKGGTYSLAFGLRVGYTSQFLKEQRSGMNADDIQSHFLIGVEHILKLVLAKQAVVDKDAGQALTNRLVEQHGSHRAVDTT